MSRGLLFSAVLFTCALAACQAGPPALLLPPPVQNLSAPTQDSTTDALIRALAGEEAVAQTALNLLIERGETVRAKLEATLFDPNRRIAFAAGDALIALDIKRFENARADAPAKLLAQIEASAEVAVQDVPIDDHATAKIIRGERRDAIRFLLDTGDPAVLDLADALARIAMATFDPRHGYADSDVSQQLRKRPREAARVLRVALVLNSESDVALDAMHLDTILGPRESSGRPTIPYLRRMLRRGKSVRFRAAEMLATYFADPHSADTLLWFVERAASTAYRRERGLWLLASVLHHPRALAILQTWMKDNDPDTRRKGLRFAIYSRSTQLLPRIVKEFENTDPEVRDDALSVFSCMPGRSLEKPLKDLIERETNSKVLCSALVSLVHFPTEENARLVEKKTGILLERFESEKDKAARRTLEYYVASALGTLRGYAYPSSRPFLRGVLKSASPMIGAAAAEALTHSGDPRGRPVLLSIFSEIKNGPEKVFSDKLLIAKTLLRIGESDFIDDLLSEAKRKGNKRLADLAFLAAIPDAWDQQALTNNKVPFERWWREDRDAYFRWLVEEHLERMITHFASEGEPVWPQDIQVVRFLTARRFGYDPLDSPEKRTAALAKWDTWFKKNKPNLVWDKEKHRLVVNGGAPRSR